jgi:hypothetical protein
MTGSDVSHKDRRPSFAAAGRRQIQGVAEYTLRPEEDPRATSNWAGQRLIRPFGMTTLRTLHIDES